MHVIYRAMNPEQRSAYLVETAGQNISEGEYVTVDELHKFCKRQVSRNRSAIVYYFHSKATDEFKGLGMRARWREYMNAMTIEFPSICFRALLSGYSTCGSFLRMEQMYLGNFFWASCNHIAALPGLWDPMNNAWSSEFFIFNMSSYDPKKIFPGHCGYNMETETSFNTNRWNGNVTRKDTYEYVHKLHSARQLPRSYFARDPLLMLPNGERCPSVLTRPDLVVPYSKKKPIS